MLVAGRGARAPRDAGHPAAADDASDLAAARQLFAANLDAIRQRDRVRYLACYLESPSLVVTGAQGFALGYAPLASPRAAAGRTLSRDSTCA